MFNLFPCYFAQNFTNKTSLYKLLFETQPACVSYMFLNFCPISASSFLYACFLQKTCRRVDTHTKSDNPEHT